MASCRDRPCDSVSCRDSRQEAKSHGQSLQEAVYQAQQSRQEARDRGQSQRKLNMTDSLCGKRKLADSFILYVTLALTNSLRSETPEVLFKLNSFRISIFVFELMTLFCWSPAKYLNIYKLIFLS